jgi:hypothetical protein
MLTVLFDQLHHHLARSPRWQLLGIGRLLVALIGIGYLFPFSALTQPVDYWNTIFPPSAGRGRLYEMDFYITTIFMWTNLVVLGVVIFLLPGPSTTKSSSDGMRVIAQRIIYGYFGQMLCLFMVPLCHLLRFGLHHSSPHETMNIEVSSSESQPENSVAITNWSAHGLLSETSHFYAILLLTASTAFATALIDSVAISFISQYPTILQESLQLGIGLSTLIGSIYRILTKLIFPSHAVVASTFLYFFFGVITIMICIVGFKLLLKISDLIMQPLPLDSELPTLIQTPLSAILKDQSEQQTFENDEQLETISKSSYKIARFSCDTADSLEQRSDLESFPNNFTTTASTSIPPVKKSVTFDLLDECKDEESIPLFRQQFQRERAYSSIEIKVDSKDRVEPFLTECDDDI